MELVLRVTPAGASGDGTGATGCDVIVDADPSHTVEELLSALRELVPSADVGSVRVKRTGSLIVGSEAIGDVDLVSGDELILGGAPVARRVELSRWAVMLDVIAGPDSGTSLTLGPGRIRIGRDADNDLSIDDRSVSRLHAEAVVDDDLSVTVEPVADAVNGVTVNDVFIEGPMRLEPDDVVGLGGTRLAFRKIERSTDEHIDRLGQIDFHRTPYRPPVIAERAEQVIGPIPTRPEPRRFQVLAAFAPLAAGLTMFAFTRQVQFLALMALSPIVAIGTQIDDRRSGRRKFRDQLAAYRDGLVVRRRELEALRHAERVERLRAAPDLADLARRAELRTIDLWSRGRDAPDFLRMRLGLGTARVSYAIELERGGDDDLREEAREAIAGVDEIDNVPVTVDLVEAGVLGVHGEGELVDGVAASIVIQSATLHSPEDLTIVAATDADRGLGWIKWLPHARSVASPLSGNHVVTEGDAATAIVSRLIEVAEFRNSTTRDRERSWPHLLVVLDGRLSPDPAEVSRLLEIGPAAGLSVAWLADSAGGVPRQATQVLQLATGEGRAMLGRLWATDPDEADRDLEVEHLRLARADRVARALAPVRDASTASQATSIPRTAPLLDVLGVGMPTARWVSTNWASATEYGLGFPIGFGSEGPLELDLVENGPHTLIGGTSGAGKSELLQSMVAALAVKHPPTRLNFLFVDYKGGASSKVFEPLPHTVGYVTNLSAELSMRALTSLRAELNRRMRVMEGRAKDLAEMLEVAPADAPASLVIIVDEFATLVKEVPEFVAGVVDIAQRGRSLGIHLVLATQRPSGSVNENILANTNLRMSLRMLDKGESNSIIGSPEAADIPVPLRGRGFVRLGPRQLIEFQSAFTGAPLVTGEERQPVLAAPFERTDASPRAVGGSAGGSGEPERTHLDAVLDAVVEANRNLSLGTPLRPWREMLPELVPLGSLGDGSEADEAAAHPGRKVVVGMLDSPEEQDQRPAIVDLEEGGGWLVFGSGGSGKTTVLRTVATSIAATADGGDVAIIGLDFASRGLTSIRDLPDVVDVATGDDLEAVTRHLAVLDAELVSRRRMLADLGAENLTAYNRLHAPLPRIVVLIDGFGALASTFLSGGGSVAGASMEQWGEIVQRLIIDGRQAGIHTVLTADRNNAVPARIQSAVANRLILRHADVNSYAEYGIPTARARDLDLPPGRGLLQGETLVQIASVAADATARGQADRIGEFAARLGRSRTTALQSAALPERVTIDDLADAAVADAAGPRAPLIGVADVSGAAVSVDMTWSNLVVCGAPRSGRSTALVTAWRSLSEHHEVYAVGPSASPFAAFESDRVACGKPAELVDLLDRVANLAAMATADVPVHLVVDDADTLDDPTLLDVWTRISDADGIRIVAALEGRSMTGFTQNPVLTLMRRARRMLVLQPDDPTDFLNLTGLKLTVRPGIAMPPGRGVLLVDRQPTVLQVLAPS